jgi:sulfate adenylyltransferase subunit 1
VESGTVAVGDEIRVLPGGGTARIRGIRSGERSVRIATAEQSVSLLLDAELDVSRGDLMVESTDPLQPRKQLDAMLCWLSETPLDLNRRYVLRHTTREVKALVAGIGYRLDINTLEREAASKLQMNDIGQVSFKLAQPLNADSYAANRSTGAFIVIDEASNNTVGAAMIL